MADQDLQDELPPNPPSDASAVQVSFVQRAKAPFAATSRHIGSGVQGLANLVKLEVVVTTVCFFIPFILWYGDGGKNTQLSSNNSAAGVTIVSSTRKDAYLAFLENWSAGIFSISTRKTSASRRSLPEISTNGTDCFHARNLLAG